MFYNLYYAKTVPNNNNLINMKGNFSLEKPWLWVKNYSSDKEVVINQGGSSS